MKGNLSPVGSSVRFSQTPQHELGMRAAVHYTPRVNLPYIQPLWGFSWRAKKQISYMRGFKIFYRMAARSEEMLMLVYLFFHLRLQWVHEVVVKFKRV